MASYGISYQGSKSYIIPKIHWAFPAAENFYDLFGGGFSVTHYTMLRKIKKYENIYFNEIEKLTCDLIKDAIAGKYNYKVFKPKWIDRETFFRDKDACGYTKIVWSFGNKQRAYLYGKDIEADKKSLHNAVVFNEFDSNAIRLLDRSKFPDDLSIRGRRLFFMAIIRKKIGSRVTADERPLQQLQELVALERLQQLQQLQQLEQTLNITSLSYEQVKIKPNSLIYCDPPYQNTAGYLRDFDHNAFWDWVRDQSEPVFVSEYSAPADIKTVMAISHKKSISAKVRTDSVEKLFCNDAAAFKLAKKSTPNWGESPNR